MLDPALDPEVDRAPPSDLNLVDGCARQLGAAAEAARGRDPLGAQMITKAKDALAAALERPAVVAAFADSFSHPKMVAARLEAPTPEHLDRASNDMLRIFRALKDQYGAAEMRDILAALQKLDGPTPWDTFYVAQGRPDQALMPLFGCWNAEPLGLGPIDGVDPGWSAGDQALFYPVGGYALFAEASSVVVAQSLADGLAIDAALQGRMSCSVVVASAPDGVWDVCKDIRAALVNRAALATPAERETPSLVVALAPAVGPDSPAVKLMIQEAPANGASIVRPSVAASGDDASWSQMTPDAIAESVRSAAVSSRPRLQDAAAVHDERFDHGVGFREDVSALRASQREAIDAPAAEISISAARRSAGRRI